MAQTVFMKSIDKLYSSKLSSTWKLNTIRLKWWWYTIRLRITLKTNNTIKLLKVNMKARDSLQFFPSLYFKCHQFKRWRNEEISISLIKKKDFQQMEYPKSLWIYWAKSIFSNTKCIFLTNIDFPCYHVYSPTGYSAAKSDKHCPPPTQKVAAWVRLWLALVGRQCTNSAVSTCHLPSTLSLSFQPVVLLPLQVRQADSQAVAPSTAAWATVAFLLV